MLEIGKIPENVLKRSVFAQIQAKRPEVVLGAGVGEDCAALRLGEDEVFVLSTDPITGTAQDIGKLALNVTLNDLASAGAEPIGILLTILLPEGSEEAGLKSMMRQLGEGCAEAGVQILGGHTEVTRAVVQPLVSVCGVGKVKAGKLVTTSGARPGQDLVITKWIGLEGTSIIAKEKQAELLSRYPADFVADAQSFDQYLSVLPEAAIAVRTGVSAMHDVTEGGIFGALWEMAESSGVGLAVDLRKIPIRQETVEVCEFFGISPYELISSGSMLMASQDGNRLVDELVAAGIHAVVVGRTTEGNDRVVANEGERRFLGPPKPDALYQVVGK